MNDQDNRQLVTDDDDLDKKRAQDDFNIQRVAKFAILGLSLIVAVVVTIIVLLALCTDINWRDYAIKAVFNALPGIAAVILVVLGLKR